MKQSTALAPREKSGHFGDHSCDLAPALAYFVSQETPNLTDRGYTSGNRSMLEYLNQCAYR